jgi:hypothetical protein
MFSPAFRRLAKKNVMHRRHRASPAKPLENRDFVEFRSIWPRAKTRRLNQSRRWRDTPSEQTWTPAP